MAIKSNKKIDFEYEHEHNQNTYSFNLRFYQTEEYGYSVAILDENGDVAFNLPLSMFHEVSEFLADQGFYSGEKTTNVVPRVAHTPKQKLTNYNVPQEKLQTQKIQLPKPKIVSTKSNNVENNLKASSQVNTFKESSKNEMLQNAVPVDLENEEGDELSDLPESVIERIRMEQEEEKKRAENIASAVDYAQPVMSLSSAANQQLNLNEDEMNRILEERNSALNKVKEQKNVKKIRKI